LSRETITVRLLSTFSTIPIAVLNTKKNGTRLDQAPVPHEGHGSHDFAVWRELSLFRRHYVNPQYLTRVQPRRQLVEHSIYRVQLDREEPKIWDVQAERGLDELPSDVCDRRCCHEIEKDCSREAHLDVVTIVTNKEIDETKYDI
jgi:hypothetical protein